MARLFSRLGAVLLSTAMLLRMSLSASAAVLGDLNADKSKTHSVSSQKYDLDGDKKKDKLTVLFSSEEEGSYTSYSITVNNKKMTIPSTWAYAAKVEVMDIDKADGTLEVVVSLQSDNDYQSMDIYRWDGKTLRRLATCPVAASAGRT